MSSTPSKVLRSAVVIAAAVTASAFAGPTATAGAGPPKNPSAPERRPD